MHEGGRAVRDYGFNVLFKGSLKPQFVWYTVSIADSLSLQYTQYTCIAQYLWLCILTSTVLFITVIHLALDVVGQ